MDAQKNGSQFIFTQEELEDIDTFARMVMAARNEPLEWTPKPKTKPVHKRRRFSKKKRQQLAFILAAVTVILLAGIYNLMALVVS